MVFAYVKLVPLVRMKLVDARSIDRLEHSLKEINKKFSSNKKASDLISLVEEVQVKLKDNEFLDEVAFSVDFKDKEFIENESRLIQMEKDLKTKSKPGERSLHN